MCVVVVVVVVEGVDGWGGGCGCVWVCGWVAEREYCLNTKTVSTSMSLLRRHVREKWEHA